MTHPDPIVIVSATRTPMGSFLGALAAAPAPQLGASAIRAAVERAKVSGGDVDEVIVGNVLSAGQGQAPARQASIGAGLPVAVGCTTLNKMCGSGMKSVMVGHDALCAGSAKIVVCGGMESMSNAPYLLDRARSGLRMGHGKVSDHMFLDGLEDAYEGGTLMGLFAERCAERYAFSRQEQDDFAIRSLQRARAAIDDGRFADEITSVAVRQRKGETIVSQDEQPGRARIDKIPTLRPAFSNDGTVTAANSSSISDGAAALVLMRRSEAQSRGLAPLATIVGHATHAQEPAWFTTAPVGAIRRLMNRIAWSADEIDLFEINEAFAVVTMAAIRDLQLPDDKVNVRGGACALGHPIGASGARILVTLIHALKQGALKRGIAALCIGGGEATAIAIERG